MASNSDRTILITLLHKIAQGDESAVRTFYLVYYNQFINYGYTITMDRHAIEDAIQNFLIWIIEHPRRMRKIDRPDVYFYRSLRNNLQREKLQSNKNLNEELRDTMSNLVILKSAEMKWVQNEEEEAIMNLLQEEIEALPDYLKQALYLRYFSEMAYKEIGEILQIKPNVARIYIHRAIERLRLSLKDLKVLWMLVMFGAGVG